VPTLCKAQLQEIRSDESAKALGPPVDVQFNPATLRLRMNNSVGDGRSRGLQRRQYMGQSSTVLSLELIFDTSDDGNSVREKTAIVEKFVLPRGKGREAPPKLRFHWGVFVFDGVVEDVSIDLEYFAPNGTPLRAKVSLSIKEQNPAFQFPKASQAYDSPNVPGANVVRALAGESAPELAARVGLDPTAWRGLGVDLSGGLELRAGAEASFTVGANASAGLGLNAGINAGMGMSLEASVGLETATALPVGRGGGVTTVDRGHAAGLAVSAAGGVRAALESVAVSKTEAAREAARAGFTPTLAQDPLETTGPSRPSLGPARPAERPEQPLTPLAESGLPSIAQQAHAKPAPVGPWADRRAITFGYGVPLRAIVPVSARRTRSMVHTPYAGAEGLSEMPPIRDNPTIPSWEQLPREGSGADRENGSPGQTAAYPSGRRPAPCPCGSGGRL
jgi:hypothetical protein